MSFKIDQAYMTQFIAGAFGLPIVHENVDYTPTPQTAYVEIFQIPNEEVGLSLNDSNMTTGIFRAILRYPLNATAIDAKEKAEEIIAFFPIGSEVAYGGQSTRVTGTNRVKGVPEDGWYKIVVSISYNAFLTR